MKKVKKNALIVISILLSLVIVSMTLYFIFFKKSDSIDNLVKDLDENYTNLDVFELEAPFDTSKLNNYRLYSTSTPNHRGIDFFGNNVSTIPFLSMTDGIVTLVEPHIMVNQEGFDNWAFRIWVVINSKYIILLNFETFGNTNEVKQQQQENIFVKVGDKIKKGDLIGNLIIAKEHGHVDFCLKIQNVRDEESWVVPEPYFSDTAVGLINTVFGREEILR